MNTAVRAFIALGVAISVSAMALAISDVRADTSTIPSCSISLLSTQQGLLMASATGSPASLERTNAAVNAVQTAYPTAIILETTTATVTAPNVPPIDGRTAVVVSFRDSTPQIGSGPVGLPRQQYVVACGLAFYDAASGAFLADVKQLATP